MDFSRFKQNMYDKYRPNKYELKTYLINDGKKVYCATLDETSVNLLALPQKENR